MNHLLRIIRNTVYRFWLTVQCRVTLKFQLNYFISSAFNYYLNRRCHTYRAVWANLFKSQVSPRVCCFVVFGLFVCLFFQRTCRSCGHWCSAASCLCWTGIARGHAGAELCTCVTQRSTLRVTVSPRAPSLPSLLPYFLPSTVSFSH